MSRRQQRTRLGSCGAQEDAPCAAYPRGCGAGACALPRLPGCRAAACSSRPVVSTDGCSLNDGCVNQELLAALRTRCPGDGPYRVSLKQLLEDVERVYFITQPARLDACTTVPVPVKLRHTHDPMCQYALLAVGGASTTSA